VVVAAALAAMLGAGTARALPGGTLVITDHAIDPHAQSLDKEAKKASKGSLPKAAEGWHIYFVAWLNKAPGAKDLNLVFYSIPTKKGEEPNAFPVTAQSENAKIVMADLTVSPEVGLKPGKYNVRVTRLVGGKEQVFAKTNLELKP
jgi:hypothetical protein